MAASQYHSTLLTVLLLAPLLSAGLTLLPEGSTIHFSWLTIAEDRALTFGFSMDWLSRIIAGLVTLVSLLVHIYSVGYMRQDAGINRYFAFLGLFTFSMLGIVLSQSLLMIFFFWELVGLSIASVISVSWQESPYYGDGSAPRISMIYNPSLRKRNMKVAIGC